MTEETEKPFEEALKDLESSVQKLEAGDQPEHPTY